MLGDIWAERDLRYAQRRRSQTISAANIAAVRLNRVLEAAHDPVARMFASRWTPPERLV